MASKLKVTLKKSPVGRKPAHRGTLRALGLWKIGDERTHTVTPVLQGMVKQVSYLLKVEEA